MRYKIPRFNPAPRPPSSALSSATALHITHCPKASCTKSRRPNSKRMEKILLVCMEVQ